MFPEAETDQKHGVEREDRREQQWIGDESGTGDRTGEEQVQADDAFVRGAQIAPGDPWGDEAEEQIGHSDRPRCRCGYRMHDDRHRKARQEDREDTDNDAMAVPLGFRPELTRVAEGAVETLADDLLTDQPDDGQSEGDRGGDGAGAE